jgi:5-aminopentanamidase
MLKVCAIQASAVKYDKAANLQQAEMFMRRAADLNADAIVFPEMFLIGYTIGDRLTELAEETNGESNQKLASWAKENHLLTIFGFPERNGSALPYNSACIIESDGTILGSYRKTHLFGEEKKMFSPGNKINALKTSLGTVGIMICYDVEFPEVARLLAIGDAKLIFMIAANMYPYEADHIRYIPVRAMENSVFIAACNLVGDDGVYHYCGRSAVVNHRGDFLALGSADKDELLFAEIDFSQTNPEDSMLNYLSQRRPELYTSLSNL